MVKKLSGKHADSHFKKNCCQRKQLEWIIFDKLIHHFKLSVNGAF